MSKNKKNETLVVKNQVRELPLKATTKVVNKANQVPPKITKRRVLLSKLKRKILKHVWLVRALIVGVLLSIFGLIIIVVLLILKQTPFAFYYELAKDFVFTPQNKVSSLNNRTNIIILGKGGPGHEAPDLTDTIIFLSLNIKTPSIFMVSLPRDIWLPDLRAKLNSVYYWGNEKESGGGLILTKSIVEEIVGQPVHYVLVIDFSGFKEIIDTLGGIDINVERSFTDNKYPIAGRENDLCDGDLEYNCRYETVIFESGWQHMEGDTALKFVRSRNAQGDEGTDLARGARQEKVISAIKTKILSREILLSPKTLLKLKDTILKNIETDINPEAAAVLARSYVNSKGNTKSFVLPENLLDRPPYSPKFDNLYVFLPKKDDWNDWSDVHSWVNCELSGSADCD